MDPRERINDLEESIRIAVDRHLSTVWTAMPVQVTEDSDGHVCKLQITIKGSQQGRGGQMQAADLSPLDDVLVHYAAGGGFTITHPVKQQDEGMAVFQSRNTSGWEESGGQQEEPSRRRHHLADAMYVPGFRNKPRRLDPPPATDSLQIRLDHGKSYIEIDQDGVVNIHAPGGVNIHCPNCTIDGRTREVDKQGDGPSTSKDSDEKDTAVKIVGTLHVTRDITCDASITASRNVTGKQEVVAKNVHMTTHEHTRVQTGGGLSGPPRPGS